MLSGVAKDRNQPRPLLGHEGQITKATWSQINAHQPTTEPVGGPAQVVVEVAHRRAVTGTEVEHRAALLGQETRRVVLGSQHARTKFRPVRVPSPVLLA